MTNSKTFIRKTCLLVFLLCSLGAKVGFAQTESYIQVLTGVIKPKDVCVVVDEKFTDPKLWSTVKKNVTVQNLITFEVRYDTSINYFDKAFTCELLVDIEYKDSAMREKRLNDVKLVLQYDTVKGKGYKGIAYYKFNGGHEVKVTVKSIKSKELDVTKAAFLRVKNQILLDRTYHARSGNKEAPITVKKSSAVNKGGPALPNELATPVNGNRQMQLTWNPLDFEYDTYDLEYTFYDAKSYLSVQNFTPVTGITQTLLEDAFKNNATRVSLNESSYLLNLVYPKGFLLIRLRSYTYNDVDGEMDREEFDWHYAATDGIDATYAVYEIGNEHEASLTWQYSASFGEEGKRKEVVSYFDGGLKSRQSVTINNSDGVSVVAESVLDKQNRPALSVLPVPTTDNTLHYFPSLTRNASGQYYSYDDFNAALGCVSNAQPMHTSYGASQYYSANNPFVDNSLFPNAKELSKNVPDAAGYPFAVTEFTRDQTGRIRRQGGVGEKFQLGQGHESSYYYGKPAQEELDRLFGSEAGSASHYAKNMVVDPNGQVSISYTDIAGKTVATALAGAVPGNLKALDAQGGALKVIKDELVRPQSIVRDVNNMKLSFNSTILVPAASNYNFKYEFNGRSLELLFGFNPEKKVCADCYYDVQFSISDECNNPVPLTFNGTSYTSLLVPAAFNYGNSTGGNPNTQCGVVLPTQLGNIIAAFPKTGEYKVSYELLMSRKALDFYMEYLKQAQVMKTADEFKKDYLKKIDLTGCFSDCRNCTEKLGTFEDFKARMKKILIEEDSIELTTDDLQWILLLYNETLAKCSELVATNCTIVDGCADQRKMMLKDLTPGGQYMLYDETTLLFKERAINAFVSKAKIDPSSPQVFITRNGIQQTVLLSSLQESEIISNWDPEWAFLMLKYHPEYCFLQECESMSASKNRDKKMLQTDDEALAASLFGWNSNNYSTFISQEIALVTSPYNATCIGAAINSRVNSFITCPVKTTGGIATGNVSLKDFVKFIVYCDNKPPADPVTHEVAYVDLTCIPSTCNKQLEEWRTFRNLYMAIKQEAFRKPECKSSNTCSNCFIGVNAFSTLYNPKADPGYYPKLNDFVVEENSTSTGLLVKYKAKPALNNRCDVYVYKATASGSTVSATFVQKLELHEAGPTELAITGANMNEKELYFVEHIINNYNHNIDGTTPATNCVKESDFEVYGFSSDGPIYVKYVGAYPLLNKVTLAITIELYSGGIFTGCNNHDPDTYNIVFDPMETGPKEVRGHSGCHLRMIGFTGNYCVATPASCIADGNWPAYFQKKRRFYETNDVKDITTVLGQDHTNGTTPLGNGNNYQQNCEDMAEGWYEKLKGCFTGPTDPNWITLRTYMIAVCTKGSDLYHPFGSSTTKPGEASTYGHTSFKQAILVVMGSETPTCNSLLIDFPLPYTDKTLLNDPIAGKLSECGYRLLTRFKNEWTAAGGASNPLYPTLKEYIKKAYDPNFYLSDAQIEELRTSYTTGCPLKRPIRIPGILTRCDDPKTPTCLKCSQLYSIQLQFLAEYPQFNTSLPNYYDLFAAYINQVYQMNVAPSAVYSAVQSCIASEIFNDGCGNRCDDVINSLQQFYQVMPISDYCKMYYCKQASQEAILDSFRVHITTWLNLTLGMQQTWSYYNSNYFSECANAYYQEPKCALSRAKGVIKGDKGCECTRTRLRCCDYYAPLVTFRSLFPNPVNPRLLAYFFQMRRFTFCAPVNLPDIDYMSSYTDLISYFSHLVPEVIPYCDGDDPHDPHEPTDIPSEFPGEVPGGELPGDVPPRPGYCEYWEFTFDTSQVQCGGIYDTVFSSNQFVLCSMPLTPVFQSDPDECLRNTVRAALSNADYAYTEYVKDFMRDYREAYFAKCLNITPSLVMEGDQREYQYTLYYYDQSGNLVKTIPPKGVRYLTSTQITETGRLRDEDNGECYKNSTAPTFVAGLSHQVTVPATFYPLHKDGALTVESWVKFDNTTNKQVIVNQFDDGGTGVGKAGYYGYIENGKLYFTIYGRAKETWSKNILHWLYPTLVPNVQAKYYTKDPAPVYRTRLFKAACHTENDITSSGPSANFYHIIFQYSGDPRETRPVKIYVNGILQTLSWTGGYEYKFDDLLANSPDPQVPAVDAIKYELESVTVPFTTASATNLIAGSVSRTVDGSTMNGVAGNIKHLRIYNSAPDAADLRRNSYDGCFMPAAKDGLVLWLPLNKAVAGLTDDVQSGNSVSITANWASPAVPQYPVHKMPTYYAYNSQNQVIKQKMPDAGESKFWYDRLGRLVVSQNAEQLSPLNGGASNRYSYTRYDALGRINEVGEKSGAATMVNTRDTIALVAWMATGHDYQVTQTVYDDPDPLITTDPEILLAQLRNYNSRKRVVASVYKQDKALNNYNYATHYVYDISGNVKRLYQENNILPNGDNVAITKKIDYEFDLISGKMNQVWYQKDKQDQYLYRYYYDADNRMIDALSGRDVATLRHDGRYNYFLHGPLGRTELGHDIVQGVDYAYTLQGWLKGINGLFLNAHGTLPNYDMGKDGVAGTTHADIPADVYGYTLGYFNNDYTPVNNYGGAHPLTMKQFGYNTPGTPATGYQLFNGNIAYTTHANRVLDGGAVAAYSYQYDQLSRITEMRKHSAFTASSGTWNSGSTIADYAESIAYDANGNISTYSRKGKASVNIDMDELVYHYQDTANNNKLGYVTDNPAFNTYYSDDIDNQSTGNYQYDAVGNLISDAGGKISTVHWNVYGKIRDILKHDGTFIEYAYDAQGNRVSKKVSNLSTLAPVVYTYYFRDAQGNVMGVYEMNPMNIGYKWLEQHLYGSSRLGMWKPDITMDGSWTSGSYDETVIGTRNYELTNHLGNVLSVISDKKTAIGIGVWEAEVLSANDYYPFGMMMPERSYSAGSDYRYGFNGKENDNELKGLGNSIDFGARFYDPRLGRWFSPDPLRQIYSSISPYAFAASNPVNLIDADGNILKDKEGNIIATANALVDDKHNTRVIEYNPGLSLRIEYKYVTIYTDKGNPVTAKMVTKAVVVTTVNGVATEKDALKYKNLNVTSNCHGYAFAEGKVIIDDGESLSKILKEDSYRFIDPAKNSNEQPDLVVVYNPNAADKSKEDLSIPAIDDGAWQHSAKKEEEKNTFTDKNDEQPIRKDITAEQVKKYKDDTDDLINLTFKREKKSEGVATQNGTTENGVRIVDTQEMKRIQELIKPKSN